MDVAVRVALTLSRYISEWYWQEGNKSLPSAARQAHFSLTEATSDEFVIVFCCIGLICTAGFFFMLGMSAGWWCLHGLWGVLRFISWMLRAVVRLVRGLGAIGRHGCRVVIHYRPCGRRRTSQSPRVKPGPDSEKEDQPQMVLRERTTHTAVVRGRAVPPISHSPDRDFAVSRR